MQVESLTSDARKHVDNVPLPFQIAVDGTINDEQLSIRGTGCVRALGIYEAVLNLSTVPPDFHPSAVATFIVSICCARAAAMRNGALNIGAMGAEGYETTRTLTFGGDEESKIVVEGDVSSADEGVTFKGSIDGEARLPAGLAGNSVYVKKLEPQNGGATVHGIGEGSLFLQDGGNIPVGIESFHRLRPDPVPNPLTGPQLRTVHESGILNGRTYTTRVHAMLDDADVVNRVMRM